MWRYAAAYGMQCGGALTVLPWTLTYLSNATAAIYYAVIPVEVLVLSRIFSAHPYRDASRRGLPSPPPGWSCWRLRAPAARRNNGGAAAPPRNGHPAVAAACPLCDIGRFHRRRRHPVPDDAEGLARIITASALLTGNLIAVPALLLFPPAGVPSAKGLFWVLVGGVIVTGCGMILRGIDRAQARSTPRPTAMSCRSSAHSSPSSRLARPWASRRHVLSAGSWRTALSRS